MGPSAIRLRIDHVVLCVKANGNTMRDTPGAYIGAAEMFSGLWLAGAMAQWGWHPETFLWYEFGYGKLFAPRPIWRLRDPTRFAWRPTDMKGPTSTRPTTPGGGRTVCGSPTTALSGHGW